MSRRKRSWSWIFLRLLVGLILFYLMSPTIIIFIISFSSGAYLSFPPPGFSLQWYEKYFSDPVWVDATLQSLRIAATTSVITLSIGIPLAFGLTRTRFVGRTAIERLASSPIMVPDIVVSIAIYGLYQKLGLVGEWYGVAVAHSVLALPLVTIVLVGGLRSYDHSVELAARGLGANRLKAVWYITLPIIAPSVAVAALFAFVISFNELVVAIFSAGSIMTFPKVMYEEIMTNVEPTVAAASAIEMLAVIALALIIANLARHGGSQDQLGPRDQRRA